jgi:hypothetical protein
VTPSVSSGASLASMPVNLLRRIVLREMVRNARRTRLPRKSLEFRGVRFVEWVVVGSQLGRLRARCQACPGANAEGGVRNAYREK